MTTLPLPTLPRRARALSGPIVGLLAGLIALSAAPAAAQSADETSALASKSIARVHAAKDRVFAFAAGGPAYSQLDLFGAAPAVETRELPWVDGIDGAASWGESLLLHSNAWISDSQRVARVAALRYGGTLRGGDSLIFRDPLDTALPLADGARLTATIVRDSAGSEPAVAVLGFGRLGIAYATLAPETGANSAALLSDADSVVSFLAFPAGSDTAVALHACRWNALCRVDTLTGAPERDSVLALAVDSSHADSTWLLVATDKGVRRGLWGGTVFPYVPLPGIDSNGAAVRSVFTAPGDAQAWAFTRTRLFYSDDHGASFRAPPDLDGVYPPSALTSASDRPAHAVFRGDTTYVNFNLDAPGLLVFRRDTILANEGDDVGQVLVDAEDGLDISVSEGGLTELALARSGNAAVLVVGATDKGVFHRRLDNIGGGDTTFANINRLRVLKGKLAEVIVYPTLLTSANACNESFVRFGYRLGKDARVDITVYNYAMEKVRSVVRNAPRRGGVARSESLAEDRWDGCDDSGRFVSVGTYYVLVKSDQGEKAFGKAIVTRGRR